VSQPRHVLEEFQPEKVLRTTNRSTVFRAVDPTTGRRVAVKLVHPGGPVVDEVNRSAFLYALEIARSGVIPALPRTLDFGLTPDGSAFLVTEWMDLCAPLADLRDQPPGRLVPILRQVVNAIDGLAMAGVAHLNLSPDNVLVTVDDTIRLVGCGTAAYLVGSDSGVWPGDDDRFVAPETARGDVLRREDIWLADLYSFALMSCEVLGAQVLSTEDDEPTVRIPPGIVVDDAAAEELLATSLRRLPEYRRVSLSDLRRVLACDEQGHVPVSAGTPSVAPPGFETRKIVVPQELIAIPGGGVAVELPEDFEPRLLEDDESDEPLPDAARIELVPEDEDPSSKSSLHIPWRAVATVAAALFLLVIVVGIVVGRPRTPPRPQAVAIAPTPVATEIPAPRPEEETAPQRHAGLANAEELLLTGDVSGARAAVSALSSDEIEGFSEADREVYDDLLGTLEDTDRDRARRDLVGGLEHGSVRMLRRAMAGLADLSDGDLEAEPRLRSGYERARRALRVHESLWEAKRAGRHLAVLEWSTTMIELLPNYDGSYQLREESAAALESAADAALADGDGASAIRQLEAIGSRWPDRAGLEERIARCRHRMETDGRMRSVLEAATACGARGEPDEGLRVLAAAKPSPEFIGEFAAAQSRLQEQLTALDADSPRIVLQEGFEPRFKKNTTIVVPITVTDDYRVARVVVGLRADGEADYHEIELQSAGNGSYPLEIGPDRHGNRRLSFFVSAEDRSGHRSRLGGPAEPIELVRKRWYKK
jgi:hypothetical protein